MPKPTIAQAADYLVAELNVKSWSQSFTAERVYSARLLPKDIKNLQVLVMVNDTEQEMWNRMYRRRTHAIDIAFRKVIDPSKIAAIDALAAFVEEVADYYGGGVDGRRIIPLSNPPSTVVGVKILPIYSPDALDTDRAFFSVLTLTIEEIAEFVP